MLFNQIRNIDEDPRNDNNPKTDKHWQRKYLDVRKQLIKVIIYNVLETTFFFFVKYV